MQGLTRVTNQDDRKTLHTIQNSVLKDRKNLSKDALLNSQRQKTSKEKIKIYADPVTKTEQRQKLWEDKAVQTEDKKEKHTAPEGIDQEAYDLMMSDDIPENYWKELAEERRQALDESLNENEQLHKDLEELTEENAKLEQMASQTDYFAGVIQDLLGVDALTKNNENATDKKDDVSSCFDDKDSTESGEEENNCDKGDEDDVKLPSEESPEKD